MNPCKNDYVCICFYGLLRKTKTIPYIICYILYIRFLVVVRQQYCIFFFFQSLYLCKEVKLRIKFYVEKSVNINFTLRRNYLGVHTFFFFRGGNITQLTNSIPKQFFYPCCSVL